MGFNLPAMFAPLLLHRGIQHVFGWDSCIGDSFVVAKHPDEDVGHCMLRLGKRNIDSFKAGAQFAKSVFEAAAI